MLVLPCCEKKDIKSHFLPALRGAKMRKMLFRVNIYALLQIRLYLIFFLDLSQICPPSWLMIGEAFSSLFRKRTIQEKILLKGIMWDSHGANIFNLFYTERMKQQISRIDLSFCMIF